MPKYIESETLLCVLADTAIGAQLYDDCEEEVIKKCMSIVQCMPAADVEPVKRGEWVPDGINPHNGVVGNWHCSVCNGTSLEDSDFCPNCGAKMKE